jgi:undecaprenyl-diphosphatase
MSLLDKILELDSQVFLFINNLGESSWDPIWLAISGVSIWIPLYLLLLVTLYKSYSLKGFIILIPFIILNVVLTDTGSVWLFKEQFQRLRPCYVEDLINQMRIVKSCGGQFGFISSHASNTFGLAVLIGSLTNHQFPSLKRFLLLWAALVAYSRVYLGVHYPLDIISGAIYGSFCGYLVYMLSNKILLKT